MCETVEENFDHFMTRSLYGQTEVKILHTEIFGNNAEDQYEIAKEIKKKNSDTKKKT